MPTIDIRHPHALDKPACRKAVDEATRDLSTRFGFDVTAWHDDTLAFAGHGVEGHLTIDEKDVHVQMRLGPLLGLMRPAIEAEIRRRLRERLG